MYLNLVNPPAHAGERQLLEFYGSGPASYAVAGDPLYPGPTLYLGAVPEFVSSSGNYECLPFPSVTGNLRPNWTLIWVYSGKQGVLTLTATGGTGMTPGTYPLTFTGGGGAGAAGSITVLTPTTYTLSLANTGAAYTSAPAVSAATGGTPPTFTATAAPAYGNVPAGTNLSGESVQFFAIGGEF